MFLIKLLFCLTILAAAVSLTEKDIKDKFNGFKLEAWQINIFKETLKLLFSGNNTESATIKLNKEIDFLITALDKFSGTIGLEPIGLPRFESSFKWTVFSGGIVLKNGFLYGISTLQRRGDVIVKHTKSDLKITVPMGFSNLTFTYDYDLNFMKVGPTGKATGGSRCNKVTAYLHFDMKTLKVKLDKFSFDNLGSISFKLDGKGLTNWVINLITPVVLPLLRPVIKKVVKGYIIDGFESIFKMYNNVVTKQ
ncbi:hypothetical protein ILUMI_24536 [Ignelater luminosus]|uniref:Uncharacterized protein n=1 Tax=Ignelater luminosus TaxID=2038154 RepID=A0A8K0C702_IGNLU|nr:hypothetical protein ILUMI_24536 [Ignelater luminosus]